MKEDVLGIIGSLARQQEDFNRTMRQLTAAPEPQVIEHAPERAPERAPLALPAPVTSLTPASEPAAPPSPVAVPMAVPSHVQATPPAPKADQTDELAEQIMDLLETKPDGMTPRDIGKSVKVPHQSYKFRKAMLGLKKEGRLELLDADNPKKLRYRINGFAPDSE